MLCKFLSEERTHNAHFFWILAWTLVLFTRFMAREIICQMVLYLTIYFFIGLETAYYVVPIILIRAGLNSFEQIAPNWDPNLRGPALELSTLGCSSPHNNRFLHWVLCRQRPILVLIWTMFCCLDFYISK